MVLTRSGQMAQINDDVATSIFKAHSKKGMAVTSAANAAITMEDILKAADWSSDTVFRRFYYDATIKFPNLSKLCLPSLIPKLPDLFNIHERKRENLVSNIM